MDKAERKLVYSCDSDSGNYLSTLTLDYTDRSPISGVWQLPANTTEIAPPTVGENQKAVWNGSAWQVEDISVEPDPEPEASAEPPIQDHPIVDQDKLDMAETIIALETRIAALEGGVTA